ncbi:MAG: class II aldolase/adducin family protein [Candidatus Heimdallarchaeaceae archaeon]
MVEEYRGIKFQVEKKGEFYPSEKEKQILKDMITVVDSLPELCKIGVAGNISFKSNDFIIITTSGSSLAKLSIPSNFCKVPLKQSKGSISYFGENVPSSETIMHILIYMMRKETKFIFHFHMPNLKKLQQLNKYPTTNKFYPYGSLELAEEAVRTLENNEVLILREHGIVVVSKNLSTIRNIIDSLVKI